jgi:ribosomal protein S18 acetylase RimI-like enzyme
MPVVSTQQLSRRQLEQLAALEASVVSADGGRLKLEWGVLRDRQGDATRDFLWLQDGQPLGFLGLYAYASSTIEIAGMVAPEARRRGIATALLEAALPTCHAHGGGSALLVVPRHSVGGHAFARGRRGALEHSEHALIMDRRPQDGPADPRITIRAATRDDFGELSELLSSGFGHPAHHPHEFDRTNRSRTVIVQLGRVIVGTVRLSLDGLRGGVHGFTITPELRGRGIGRDVLRRVTAGLFDAGATTVGLEVAVENDHALGLYLSLGFERLSTEDYYELTLSQA